METKKNEDGGKIVFKTGDIIENGTLVIKMTDKEAREAEEMFKDLEDTLPFKSGSEALSHSRKRLLNF